VAPEDLDVNLQYELLDVLSRIDDDRSWIADTVHHRPHGRRPRWRSSRAPKPLRAIRRGCRIKHSSLRAERARRPARVVLAQAR